MSEPTPITSIGEAATFLEGRVAATEVACALLASMLPVANGKAAMVQLLKAHREKADQSSEPGYRRGYKEGVDRLVSLLSDTPK